MDKTVLFHIGMHKTGTTWLQTFYFTNTNYFNLINDTSEPWNDTFLRSVIGIDDTMFSAKISKERLEKNLKSDVVNVVSAERMSGHPISGGYDMQKIAERLYQICPQAKILLTTRETIPFIKSVYRQLIREGYCGTAKLFLNGPKWKTINVNKSYFLQDKIKDIYRGIFGSNNVLILDYETFNQDKPKYLKTLEDFLEIPQSNIMASANNDMINKTYSNRRLRALRMLNRFRKSEIHPFPTLKINVKIVLALSIILSIFFSNRELIDSELLSGYLTRE